MKRSMFARFALGAALLAVIFGCQKSREGTRCVEGDVQCIGPTEAYLCVHTVLRKTACRGANGCNGNGCDESIAAIGEPCFTSKTPFACNETRDELLACENGKFTLSQKCACNTSQAKAACR